MALAGDKLVAVATSRDTQETSGTESTGVYTATLVGGTACSGTFVAPPSGAVKVHNSCQVQASAGFSFCSFEVRAGGVIGSGAVIKAAVDDDAIICPTAGLVRGTSVTDVEGLTAGSTYNWRQMFKGGGTGTFSRKHVSVEPVL